MERLGHRSVEFGSDPEFFIRDIKTRKVITADKILPSKNKKLGLGVGQAFFDGCQAEININPSACREYFQDNIFLTLKNLDKHINGTGPKRYQFWVIATVKMDKKSIMDADPECRRFGCDPSLNAYVPPQKININGTTHLYRYAGGHIHLGHKCSEKEAKDKIKIMDRVVGIMSTLLDTEAPSIKRRRYYGQAGEYRIQPHGAEYRTLSNFWLRAPELSSLILGMSRVAHTIQLDGTKSLDFIQKVAPDDKIRAIINTTNIAEARRVFDKMKPYLTNVDGPIGAPEGLQFFEYVARNGINSFFNRNLITDWRLRCQSSSHGNNARGWWRGMHYRLINDTQFKKFAKLFDKKEGSKLKYYQAKISTSC